MQIFQSTIETPPMINRFLSIIAVLVTVFIQTAAAQSRGVFGSAGEIILAPEPTVPSSNISLSNTNCNELDVNWIAGDGARRLVVASANSPVSALPADGITYNASNLFGQGSDLGGGNFVVYSSNGTSVTVTGLTGGVRYHFAIFEYNGSGGGIEYLQSVYPVADEAAIGVSITAMINDPEICRGDTTLLEAHGDLISYVWNPSSSLSSPVDSVVQAFPLTTTNYTVTGFGSNGCSASAVVTVDVNQPPTVTLSSFNDACSNGTAFALSGGSPSGGVYSGDFVTAGNFNPSAAGPGTFQVYYTYTDGNGCTNLDSSLITVNAPPSVQLSPFDPECVNGSPTTLSGGNPAGGTYSGDGVSGGIFYPAQAGVGTAQIIYRYFASNGCSNSDTNTIQVLALPQVTLGAFTDVCQNVPAFQLTGGLPAGGTYSGPGVSSGSFNPAVTGPGTFTIDYTYTDGNGCTNTTIAPQTVNALPTVTFTAPAPVCANTAPFALSGGTPAGGDYSGTSVVNNTFNPSVSGAGVFALTYLYTDLNGCQNSAVASITVNSLPSVTLTAQASTCLNSAPDTLSGGVPAGGVYSGNGVANGIFNPQVAGAGSTYIFYTVTSSQGCSASDSSLIEVKTLPAVSLDSFPNRCVNAGPLTLSGGLPAGGTWSGPGVGGTTFFTAIAGVGTHAINYTVTGTNGCSNIASQSISVNPAPVIGLGPDTLVCAGASVLLNAGAGAATYAWSTGATTQTISVDTTGRGTGTFQFRVTVVSTAGCLNKDTINVAFDVCSALPDQPVSDAGLILFPNPSGSRFNLNIEAAGRLSVYNLQGQLVYSSPLEPGHNTFGEMLFPGIYIAEVSATGSRRVFRIVKD